MQRFLRCSSGKVNWKAVINQLRAVCCLRKAVQHRPASSENQRKAAGCHWKDSVHRCKHWQRLRYRHLRRFVTGLHRFAAGLHHPSAEKRHLVTGSCHFPTALHRHLLVQRRLCRQSNHRSMYRSPLPESRCCLLRLSGYR